MEIKDTHWETELDINDGVFKIMYGSGNQSSNGMFINISFYHKKNIDKKIDDRELFKMRTKLLRNIRENSYIYNRYFKSSMIDYRKFDDYHIKSCELSFQEFELTLFFKRYINIRHYIIEEIVRELVSESLPIIQETKIIELVNRNETKKSKRK